METGKTALVTGASRGIGLETARQLVARGWKVGMTARSGGILAEVAESLGPENALAVQCDVADWSEVQSACGEVSGRFGTITALVNNAGVIDPVGRLADTDPVEWVHLLQINIGGPMNAARAVLPGMLEQGRGVVVNLSSGAAHSVVEGWSSYCSSKAGLNMFTRCLAAEYGPMGIRVHDFVPGLVSTGMLNGAQRKFDNFVSRIGDEAKLTPELPARCIAWLIDEGEGRATEIHQSIRDPELRAMAGLEEREQW